MTLTVTNRNNSAGIVFWRSSQRYDFTVTCGPNALCSPIWQWSHDKVFTQELREETLAAGQSVTYSETWEQRDNEGQAVVTGAYQAYASLLGCWDQPASQCDPLVSNAVAFEIAP